MSYTSPLKGTPLYANTTLMEIPAFNIEGKTIRFKMETQQPCGSFKLRGMDCACRTAAQNGAKKFLSSSGGNAGLAVAYCGYKLGIPTTVVLPSTTAPTTIDKLHGYKAEVIIHGDVWDEANKYCLKMLEEDSSISYIHPFNDPLLWEGHATLIDELKEQCEEQPDLIICSVGGGGLMLGMVEGLKRNGWNDTKVLAVETIGADSLNCAVDADKLIAIPGITSVAKSLGATCVAEEAFKAAKTDMVIPARVTDEQAVKALLRFADEARVIVEPACSASMVPVFENMDLIAPYKNIVVVACGGSNINLDILNGYKEKFGL